MQMTKKQAVVSPQHSRQLAFWETLIDIDDGPVQYLDAGEKVTIITDTVSYGGVHADKEYCKVQHPIYGTGYMLKEGLALVLK